MQELALPAFEHECGEHSGRIRTRVDADPIVPHLRLRADGVAVHDDLAVISLIVEKKLPNPQNIVVALRLEWNAGPNPRVHEEISALNVPPSEIAQQSKVRFGQYLAQLRPHIFSNGGEAALYKHGVRAP